MPISNIKVGEVFATNKSCDVEVLEYNTWDKIKIKFLDEHEHTKWVQSSNIKNPFEKSHHGVGFMAEGIYTTKDVSYPIWRSMLNRCYGKGHSKTAPSYKECSVQSDWHNFQIFAEWVARRDDYFEGWQLDKDILIKNNKIYSEDACCFVPREINSLFCKSRRGAWRVPYRRLFHKRVRGLQGTVETRGSTCYFWKVQ